MSASFEVYKIAQKLSLACKRLHADLVAEFRAAHQGKKLAQWHEPINVNQKWLVGGVKWADAMLEQKEIYPILHGLTLSFSDVIVNAGYSLLLPGAEISPHKGYSKAVIRMHYGLIVPTGDLGLLVDGHKLFWHEKESVIFDDTLEHSAWNRTDKLRAVVLFDLKKT